MLHLLRLPRQMSSSSISIMPCLHVLVSRCCAYRLSPDRERVDNIMVSSSIMMYVPCVANLEREVTRDNNIMVVEK